MKLATLKISSPRNETEKRDGRLVVVNDDKGVLANLPSNKFPSLRQALEEWNEAESFLREVAESLQQGTWRDTQPLKGARFMSPLPRTWGFVDGSAFVQHIILVRKARGAEPPEDMKTVPLMYQGVSDTLLGPEDDIPQIDFAHGTDFEGEVAVIVTDVPMGTKANDAHRYIKLALLLNDVSLRNLIPRELQAGFGFFQSKPASSCSPYAVTLDELGNAWREERIHLPLTCTLNGKVVGSPNAGEMFFSFGQLIEHAAATRALSAGTIIGSGTVSNEPDSAGIACLAERRMREKIATGTMTTPFMKVGDRIRIEMFRDGKSVFGAIDQQVARS